MGCICVEKPKLKKLPEDAVNRAINTRTLNLDGKGLEDLSILSKLKGTSMNVISAQKNRISSWPVEYLESVSKIFKLDLRDNQLGEIPETINKVEISKLLLDTNHIGAIDCFRGLNPLVELSLRDNLISSVQEGLADSLHKLEMLDLSGNKLKKIEKSIWALPKLKFLFLARNEIEDLEGISWNLTLFTTLDLSENKITTIPEELLGESRVSSLNLKGNSIKREKLIAMKNFKAFEERRKSRKQVGFDKNLDINFSLCGL